MPNPYIYQPNYQQMMNNPMMPQFQPQSFQAQPQMQMPQQQKSAINWVQGDIGARAFYVQPGTTELMMDSEAQNFYIKSADMAGMPTLKKYAYSEVVEEPLRLESHDNSEVDTAFHATREEVKQLHEEIKELKEKLATMEEQSTTKTGGRKNG